MTNRRAFIKNIGLLGLATPFLNKTDLFSSDRKLPALGIQLYMVKENMEKDTPGTLKQLGEMGYTQIESYGGNKGMFWGMSNKEFQKLANGYGLTLVSSHYNHDAGSFEQQAEKAAEIGMKYLICPWKGPQKSIDNFKRFADEFNKNGEICKKHGMRFGYHPHDYPYKKVDGQLPIDVLLANTDKDLVDFQMDFYYTVTEGQDPEEYIKKYSHRFKLCHMRDVLKERLPKGSEEESACDLGQGIINYPHLLSTGLDNGMKYFFVEQSRFYHETPLQSAKVNIDYLKKLRLA
jgi:sugar phosphate isomerase/epimerase